MAGYYLPLAGSTCYCWGEHKSVSQCRSERPYERERQSMCKDIYRLEGILSGYTEEELEVRKYIVNIKDEQLVLLVCYHHSRDQMINYRMHTTPEGIVTKVEIEKKVKGKKVWEELKQLTGE